MGGAYIPRDRITAETIGTAWNGFRARNVTEKRVPNYDEDAVTMAVEAANDALATSAYDRSEIGTFALGTTTPPIDEGDLGVRVAKMLDLSTEVDVSVFTQSTRAGTHALRSAIRADGPALAIGADCPVAAPGDARNHAAGAGAVAFVTTPNGEVIVTDTASFAAEYPGTRFRRRGSEHVESYGATTYERDAYATAVAGAVAELDPEPTVVALTAPNGALPSRGARALPFETTATHLATELGDVGAASALFSLLAAWEDGVTETIIVGYGDGAGADALAINGRLNVDWRWPGPGITYAEYLRKRGHVRREGGGR